MILVAVCLTLVMFTAGCGKVKEEEAYIYGMESWVYGYPIVLMEVTREVLTAAPAPNSEGTAAPINQLAKMPHYVSPDFKNVVRISLNSLWTTGWVDLEKEPIVLSVPDTHDRHYVFSIMNMWTDVFGSAGKRTTGTGRGNFLIAGPNWKGAAPSDIKQTFRSSTRYAWVLGQTQANGPDDFAAVNAIQAEYKLTPLSAWGKPYTPSSSVAVDSEVDVKTIPPDQVARMDAGTFFNRLALAMKDNPPYTEDGPALEKLKKLGIEPGKPFDITKTDPEIVKGLNKAVKEVQIKLAEDVTKIKNVNGWMQPHNLGRYGTDYNTRAGIAYLGLGADMQEDTIYPTAYVDGDGNSLDSANKYVMHYEKGQLTPTNATWSVRLAPLSRPKLRKIKVVFGSHDSENLSLCETKSCYIHFAHPEDRATLGSDPSAEVGGYTVRQGSVGSALSFPAPESPESDKPKRASAANSTGALYPRL